MALVRCLACGCEIPDSAFQESSRARCPTCSRAVTARRLPALFQSAAALPPPMPDQEPAPGEAVCFYNPTRRATKVCDHCGVLVSESWSARWGVQNVCLKCLEALRNQQKDTRFEARRTLWDNAALACALGPFVLAAMLLMTLIGYPFAIMCLLLTFITAPAAIFIALRFWKSPRSLVPRSPLRLVSALLFSLLQIAGWIIGGVALVQEIAKN